MRLLLAEDEKELSDALLAILKHHHYSVDAVYNGIDALSYAEVEKYDAIILDVMMPKMDGFEVLSSLRNQGNKVPVLILTARGEIDDRVQGLDLGADDYLTKPFAVKELLARIRSITRRNMEAADSRLMIQGTELNCASFMLATAKGSIHLPNKEYQMMEMLMANKGQVISVDRFFEKIWGYEAETDNKIVWVYISNLRKKLASLQSDVTIKVARGQGYYLEEK